MTFSMSSALCPISNLAVRRRSTCRCWPRRPIKDSRLACSPATRPICRSRRQLLHSWLPYGAASMRLDAKISRASPVVLRLADQRHWSRLAFLVAANKTRLPARPTQPAIPRPPSRASLSRLGEHHLARRSQGPPSPLPPAPANEQPPRSATLCLIIDNKSLSFCKATSYPTPLQALP